MHNEKVQNSISGYKGEDEAVKKDPHKEFVKGLRKQIITKKGSTEEDSTRTKKLNSEYKKIKKELEAKFDEIFADLDDDD